jgi:uncharacterized linocin/CFP29 family protein
MIDYVFNGKAYGSVAAQMMQSDFDAGALRPFIGNDRRSYISLQDGADKDGPKYRTIPLANAAATLLREEWKYIDQAVIEAAQPRLRAWADLRGSGGTLTIPQGMGKTVVESSRIKDITPAKVSMDGVAMSDMDIPGGDTIGVPLPIIHKDFKFSARQIAVSRNGAIPLDTTAATMAARKVAEEVEKMTVGIGAGAGYSFGGYTVHGYTEFPDRLTYEITDPTTGGWDPMTLVKEIIGMRKAAEDVGFYGPFTAYISSDWSAVLDEDYKQGASTSSATTIRQRVSAIDGISRIVTLDYLTGYQILLIQLTPDVARSIVGMDLTTLQWEQHGGMEVRLKVMAIMVPQLRADFYKGTGIVHGNVAVS